MIDEVTVTLDLRIDGFPDDVGHGDGVFDENDERLGDTVTEALGVVAGEREDETERNGDEDDDPLPVRNELTDAEEEAKEEILHVCLAVIIDDAE